MSNSSIWPIDRTLSGAMTQGSRLRSNSNKGVFNLAIRLYCFFSHPAEWEFHKLYEKINSIINNRERKEEKTKHGFRTAKRRKVKFGTFKHSCVCHMWLSPELSKNPTQQPKMLTHLVIVFAAPCLRSWLHTVLQLLWTHILEPTDQHDILGLNVWLSGPEFHSWLPMSFVLSSSLADSCRYSSLCGLYHVTIIPKDSSTAW